MTKKFDMENLKNEEERRKFQGNFEEVAEFKYLGTNRNEMHKEIKHWLNSGNALQDICHPNFSQKTLNLKYIKRLFSQLHYMDAKHGLLL